mmetsp:Transcript_23189/g.69462  ORF Transcript_23189/g.69462 Transcript_23189/m.69462 type:complete len:222 (-) Transcript_23189:101-766(-)
MEVAVQHLERRLPGGRLVFVRVELLGRQARRLDIIERQLEDHAHVGRAVRRRRLRAQAPHERVGAHELEALQRYNELKLALDVARGGLRGRVAGPAAAAHEPPVGLRLDAALAEQQPQARALARADEHVRAAFHERVEREAVLAVRQEHGLLVVVAGDEVMRHRVGDVFVRALALERAGVAEVSDPCAPWAGARRRRARWCFLGECSTALASFEAAIGAEP